MGTSRATNTALALLLVFSSLTCLCFSLSSLPTDFSIIDENLHRGDSDNDVSEELIEFNLFQRWKETYKKAYKTAEEGDKRFDNFKRNLMYVWERNNKRRTEEGQKGHFVGMNKFADMSNQEFKRVYGSKIKKPASRVWNKLGRVERKVEVSSKSSLDWRDYGIVTAVKDQGECGN